MFQVSSPFLLQSTQQSALDDATARLFDPQDSSFNDGFPSGFQDDSLSTSFSTPVVTPNKSHKKKGGVSQCNGLLRFGQVPWYCKLHYFIIDWSQNSDQCWETKNLFYSKVDWLILFILSPCLMILKTNSIFTFEPVID